MKRLPLIAASLVVLALVVVVAWWRHEPAQVAPTPAAVENPACRTLRNVAEGVQVEPNGEDTRAARKLSGSDVAPAYIYPLLRQKFAQAQNLLEKIDEDGTAALAALPTSTPNIDTLINHHLANLVWARSMLGVFYEQGRVITRLNPNQAAIYYQKALDTKFTDDRGCVHHAPVGASILKHYAGVLIYDYPTPENHEKALNLLTQGGAALDSAHYLLTKNMLPRYKAMYFADNLDEQAAAERNRPPPEEAELVGALGRVLLGFAVVAVVVVGAIIIVRRIRRRLGYKDEASLYRTVFAVYDKLHGLVARFGLVAEGLIGCFIGLSILVSSWSFGAFGNFSGRTSSMFGGAMYGQGFSFIVLITGLSAFLGGVAKLVEAVRLSGAPRNTLVHGSARPASEAEAQAAARGDLKSHDLQKQIYPE